MSNHTESRMLNKIWQIPELQSVFQTIGTETTQSIIVKILQISNEYDCNSDEILDEIGEQLGVCYHCNQAGSNFIDGVCQNCYETYFTRTS